MMQREEHSYPDIRIGFSTTPGDFLSWIIRLFTGGKYSHSWISYPSRIWSGRWIAHSDSRGVRKIPAEPYLAKKKRKHAAYRCKFDARIALQENRKFIGRRYDFLSILFGFPIKFFVYWISGKRICNPSRDESKFTCSEFVATVLKSVRVPRKPSHEHSAPIPLPWTEMWDPESMTPRDLREYCDAHPEFFEKLEIS